MIDPGVLQRAAARGTEVHHACKCHALGTWCPPLPDDCIKYFASFQKWFDQYVDHVLFTEHEVKSKLFSYIGHIDLVIVLRGHSLPSVWDLKTPTQKHVTWRAQISAYRQALHESEEIETEAGYSLRLRADGGAAIADQYTTSAEDFAGFLNALNAYRYFNS